VFDGVYFVVVDPVVVVQGYVDVFGSAVVVGHAVVVQRYGVVVGAAVVVGHAEVVHQGYGVVVGAAVVVGHAAVVQGYDNTNMAMTLLFLPCWLLCPRTSFFSELSKIIEQARFCVTFTKGKFIFIKL